MEIGFNIVHVLMWFGILQGLFLGVFFIFRYKYNQCSMLFSLLLISMGIHGVLFIARDIFQSNSVPIIFMPLANGPLFWGYIKSFRGNKLKFWSFIIHLLPFALINSSLLIFYLSRSETGFFQGLNIWLPWVELFVLLYWITYFVLSLSELNQLGRLIRTNRYSWVRTWVVSISVLFGIYSVVWAGYIIIDWEIYGFSMTTKGYYLGAVYITVIIYFLSTYRLGIPETVRVPSGKSKSIPDLYIGNQMEKDKILEYFKKNKPYLNDQLGLESLSMEIGISPKVLSNVINLQFNSHFNDFLNKYRVDEVKMKLADPSLNHYSSWGIGMDAGFSSKSVYYSVFKKATGISPARYRKEIQQKSIPKR